MSSSTNDKEVFSTVHDVVAAVAVDSTTEIVYKNKFDQCFNGWTRQTEGWLEGCLNNVLL
jgi:hypothetical protein